MLSILLFAITLVFINGFFVAAEFALVKIRPSRLDERIEKNITFAATARWLTQRMDASLSACQLGITMASLGLGWIGEPAIAHFLRPLLQAVGVVSEIWIHGIAFAVAFTAITAAHLVFGEQAPKIFALRRPEKILLFALPLKIFYFISYPFMIALNAATSFLLKKIGVESVSEHDAVHSEGEIKALLGLARKHGELSRSEHRLINAVFEFDDTVVVDEYGTIIGCANLEDVIEQIVGPVEDEFDTEPLEVVQDGPGKFIVSGGALIAVVNRQLNLNLASVEAETLSGLLMENTSRVLNAGDRIELNGAVATVLELKGSRASSILMEV